MEPCLAPQAASLARLLRQMPRLYIVTLRRREMRGVLRDVAKLTIPLLENFALSPLTVYDYENSMEVINTLYVSGRASLPGGLYPNGEILDLHMVNM